MDAENTKLVIFATFTAKQGKADELLPILQTLVEHSRAEPGCVEYFLHRSVDKSDTFMFYETWFSKSAFELHLSTPHFIEASNKFGLLVETSQAMKALRL